MARRKLVLFREQGAIRGIVIIELGSGGYRFKDQRGKDFFLQSMYQRMEGDPNNRIRRLPLGEGEYYPVESVHATTDCLSVMADNGTDCWVSLFGYITTMEFGRQYMYLI